jgi:hypothetical protein
LASSGAVFPKSRRTRRALLALLGLVVLVGLGVLGGLHYATRSIEERVLRALGPGSEVREIKVGLHEVELLGVRVSAPKGWPAETALEAGRVVLTPKLRELLSDRMELTEARIERAYVSAVRPKGGGGLRILPGVVRKSEKQADDRGGASIRELRFENCTIDLYDATVPLRPQRVRIEGVTGTLKDIELPELDTRIRIELDGVLKGPVHKGTIAVRGWVEGRRKNAELDIEVKSVDLAVFEPYFVTKAKTGVDTGTFDIDIKARVRDSALHAPGTLTVHGLKLGAADNPAQAIAGLPRRAAVGALSDDKDRINVPFTLDGKLEDPTFAIAGKTALHAGIAVAKASGLSFEGLVRGLFIILAGFGMAFGGTGQG